MNNRNRTKIIVSLVLVIFAVNSFLIASNSKVSANEFHISLRARTYNTMSTRIDYLNLIKQQFARIGIDLEVDIRDFIGFDATNPPWIWDFDMTVISLSSSGMYNDLSDIFKENSTLNISGYHTDMDWDEKLGTGKNEWYIKECQQMMPPNSEEKIQLYWEWQDYMMDKILPVQPMFTQKRFQQSWSTLNGYNYSNGILQSWGKMSWDSLHPGQISTSEIVISDEAWSDLNPISQRDDESEYISNAIIDPLFWIDYDRTFHPHLATNFEMMNDTHLRIHLRDGVKWQSDPDGNFTNEYFDAEDVYFSLYSMKEIYRYGGYEYSWIEDMKMIDKYTIDIFIDDDIDTPENEPYPDLLEGISVKILPEHYLNQTQFPNSEPDVTHPSWNIFSENCFGTGLFQIDEFIAGNETTLTVNPDSWWLNSTITNDPALDWVDRFGDYSGGLNQLRIRYIPYDTYMLYNLGYDIVAQYEFENGLIDIAPDRTTKPIQDDRFSTQRSSNNEWLTYLFYNIRPVRDHIGDTQPCANDPSITKGLAIRKAMSHAINRIEMNDIVHGGEQHITDCPIYESQGIFCNPNIIRYDYDLEQAKYYMNLAGYGEPVIIGFNFSEWVSFLFITAIIIVTFKQKKIRDKR